MVPAILKVIFIVSVLLAVLPFVAGLDREACFAHITEQLNNGNLTRYDVAFKRDSHGAPMSSAEDMVLTLPGCRAHCGGGKTWYHDAAPRINTWMLPIVILVANLNVSPLDKRRYLEVIRILGDPIDSIWSILVKLDLWNRCYEMAALRLKKANRNRTPSLRDIKTLATLYGGIEELDGKGNNPRDIYESLLVGSVTPRLDYTQRKTALELADARSDDISRTWLALLLYLYQAISSFIANLGGGNTSPPGGRIGTAMFMSWIVPVILLTNIVGGFTSPRSCFDIMQRFAREYPTRQSENERLLRLLQGSDDMHEYLEELCWTGAIYTYRPDKSTLVVTGSGGHTRSSTLFVFAAAPVFISTFISLIMVWHIPPNGIECRVIMLLVLGISYLLSALFTSLTWRWKRLRGKWHWHLTVAKDSVVSLYTIIILFLSSSGLFNSCWCRSGVILLGESKAYIPLNIAKHLEKYNATVYPGLFAASLSLQLGVLGLYLWFGKKGLSIMRWSEKERRREWLRLQMIAS